MDGPRPVRHPPLPVAFPGKLISMRYGRSSAHASSEIGERYEKDPGQVALRWLLEQDGMRADTWCEDRRPGGAQCRSIVIPVDADRGC